MLLVSEPRWPKEGTVPHRIVGILTARQAVCRRDFAVEFEIYEVSNRIGELKDLGWPIENRPCKRHDHRAHIVEYFIERENQPSLFDPFD